MNLFTKTIDTSALMTFCRSHFEAEDLEVEVFKNVPGMVWLYFTYQKVKVRIVHHFRVNQYSFEGSSLKVEIAEDVPETIPESFLSIRSYIGETLAKKLGGILEEYDEISGFDQEGANNSRFMLEHLLLLGVSDDELEQALGPIYDKENLKDLKKIESRKKPNGH